MSSLLAEDSLGGLDANAKEELDGTSLEDELMEPDLDSQESELEKEINVENGIEDASPPGQKILGIISVMRHHS